MGPLAPLVYIAVEATIGSPVPVPQVGIHSKKPPKDSGVLVHTNIAFDNHQALCDQLLDDLMRKLILLAVFRRAGPDPTIGIIYGW